MKNKFIGPKLHGAIDYGFVTLQTLAPTLFGLKKVIPFRVHGQLETPFVPALLVLPWLTGALKQGNARAYFFSFFSIALTNYLLTDYKANERETADKNAMQSAI